MAELKGRLRAATSPIFLLQRTDIRISNEKIAKLIERGEVNGKFETANLVYTPKIYEKLVLDRCLKFWKTHNFLIINRLDLGKEKQKNIKQFIEFSKDDSKEILIFPAALISRKLVAEMSSQLHNELESENLCDISELIPEDFPSSDRIRLAREILGETDKSIYLKLDEFHIVEPKWLDSMKSSLLEASENLGSKISIEAISDGVNAPSKKSCFKFQKKNLIEIIAELYPELDENFCSLLADKFFSTCESTFEAAYSKAAASLQVSEDAKNSLLFKNSTLMDLPGMRKKKSNLISRIHALFERFQVFSRGIAHCYNFNAFKKASIIQELEDYLVDSLGLSIIDCVILTVAISSNILIEELESDIERIISRPLIFSAARRVEVLDMFPRDVRRELASLLEKRVRS